MTFTYSFCKDIDLHVESRITAEDAKRRAEEDEENPPDNGN